MSPGEAARLYQCALEERRLVRERADELIASEAVEAIEHMDREVDRAYADVMRAVWP